MAYIAKEAVISGQSIVVLESEKVQVSILKEGANLYSWIVDGVELMGPFDLEKGVVTGTPVLFPTPNRVWNAAYKWNGKIIHQRLDGQPLVLHGLVRTAEFEVKELVCGEEGSKAVLAYSFREGERFESFPFPCTLTLTFALDAEGLRLDYAVVNEGEENMAFGFAIHPFFTVMGNRADTYIQVPAPYFHETSPELFPTGKVFKVDNTRYDLRELRSIEGCALDDVYYGMGGKEARAVWKEAGHEVVLQASEDFTHMVVFTPPGAPFFCLENQTCSTDAFNRHEAGFKETAHLIELDPGQCHTGWVTMKHQYLK